MAERCEQELCAHWTGDGCVCAVLGVDRPGQPSRSAWPVSAIRSTHGGAIFGWPSCEECDAPGREVCPACGLPVAQSYDRDRDGPFCDDLSHDEEAVACWDHRPRSAARTSGRYVTGDDRG